jgi:hypothetical protein
MVDRIYHGLDGRLRPAAIRSVVCHLVSLERRGMLRTVSTPAGPEYELTPSDSGPSA